MNIDILVNLIKYTDIPDIWTFVAISKQYYYVILDHIIHRAIEIYLYNNANAILPHLAKLNAIGIDISKLLYDNLSKFSAFNSIPIKWLLECGLYRDSFKIIVLKCEYAKHTKVLAYDDVKPLIDSKYVLILANMEWLIKVSKTKLMRRSAFLYELIYRSVLKRNLPALTYLLEFCKDRKLRPYFNKNSTMLITDALCSNNPIIIDMILNLYPPKVYQIVINDLSLYCYRRCYVNTFKYITKKQDTAKHICKIWHAYSPVPQVWVQAAAHVINLYQNDPELQVMVDEIIVNQPPYVINLNINKLIKCKCDNETLMLYLKLYQRHIQSLTICNIWYLLNHEIVLPGFGGPHPVDIEFAPANYPQLMELCKKHNITIFFYQSDQKRDIISMYEGSTDVGILESCLLKGIKLTDLVGIDPNTMASLIVSCIRLYSLQFDFYFRLMDERLIHYMTMCSEYIFDLINYKLSQSERFNIIEKYFVSRTHHNFDGRQIDTLLVTYFEHQNIGDIVDKIKSTKIFGYDDSFQNILLDSNTNIMCFIYCKFIAKAIELYRNERDPQRGAIIVSIQAKISYLHYRLSKLNLTEKQNQLLAEFNSMHQAELPNDYVEQFFERCNF